jgi:hypothetical protein
MCPPAISAAAPASAPAGLVLLVSLTAASCGEVAIAHTARLETKQLRVVIADNQGCD